MKEDEEVLHERIEKLRVDLTKKAEVLKQHRRYEDWVAERLTNGQHADILTFLDWIEHVDEFDPEK